MRAPPRGLSSDEAALWAQVAATVTPLHPAPPLKTGAIPVPNAAPAKNAAKPKGAWVRPVPPPPAPSPKSVHARGHGLDSHWERRLRAGTAAPELTLDLHGYGLDAAHQRLDAGLAQARAMGARVVLVIAGRHRPVEHADRGERRGAIRAKLLDWLAAGPHASAIAAIRPAHPRHGGGGALYLVLRRER